MIVCIILDFVASFHTVTFRRLHRIFCGLAKIIIGLCFLYGIVLPKNADRALAVLREVADRNDVGYRHMRYGYSSDAFDAKMILAHLYSYGIEVKQDNTIAETWLKQAFYLQVRRINLGIVFVDRDYIRTLIHTANLSDPQSQKHLGDCYYYGYGVEKNIFEAIAWYQKSAGQGNVSAQVKLGYFYQHGIGVEKDLTKAKGWYQIAVEHGDVIARILMDLLK